MRKKYSRIYHPTNFSVPGSLLHNYVEAVLHQNQFQASKFLHQRGAPGFSDIPGMSIIVHNVEEMLFLCSKKCVCSLNQTLPSKCRYSMRQPSKLFNYP